MRYFLMFMLLVSGVAMADESLNNMYDAFNGDYTLRESRRQRLNSYANSGQSLDSVIAQLQEAKQMRLQREMIEELQAQRYYEETVRTENWKETEARHQKEQHERFCSENPTNLNCK